MKKSGIRKLFHKYLSPEQRRIIKFLVVGTSGVPVNLGVVYLATNLMSSQSFQGLRDGIAQLFNMPTLSASGLRDFVAYGLGVIVSIFTNFLLNNFWTWGDRVAGDNTGQFFKRLVKFYLVSSVAAAFQLGTSSLVSALVRGNEFFATVIHGDYRIYHIVAPLIGILVGLVINFVANNLWTFKKKRG